MGTRYKGTDKEITALNTFIKLARAAESTISRVNTTLSKYNLTESQYAILDALYHIGPLFQKDLGNKLLKTGGNITLVIDNLEKRKLVERERREQDRRYFTIHLTRQGKSLFQKVFPGYLKSVIEEMQKLSKSDQVELQRLCKVIGLAPKNLKK
jgi:MarR family transcriptional regulator, 2-MHQ and catechol-resistance regulon repressor